MVSSPDDDQVLEATGHKELAILQESQVSCTHEWAFRPVAQVCPESAFSLLRFLPVPLGNARARDPDLSYLVGRARGRRFCIYNDDLLTRRRLAGAYKCAQSLHIIGDFNTAR